MTNQVETCHPDIYTVVYKVKVVLLADIRIVFICML